MTNEMARIRTGKNTKERKRFETFTFFWDKTSRSVSNDMTMVASKELNNNATKTKSTKQNFS